MAKWNKHLAESIRHIRITIVHPHRASSNLSPVLCSAFSSLPCVEEKPDWFTQQEDTGLIKYLSDRSGVPSHDTISDRAVLIRAVHQLCHLSPVRNGAKAEAVTRAVDLSLSESLNFGDDNCTFASLKEGLERIKAQLSVPVSAPSAAAPGAVNILHTARNIRHFIGVQGDARGQHQGVADALGQGSDINVEISGDAASETAVGWGTK